MRKLLLISAFVLASASVQASERHNFVLAANDAPATAGTAATEARSALAAEAAKPQGARKNASRNKAPRESDEQKARRIAAKYGVYW